MNEFLLYILKSTLCISFLYLVFRTLMRKETFFSINRLLLVTIVLVSLIIPLLQLPQIFHFEAPKSLIPAVTEKDNMMMFQPGSGTMDATDVTSLNPVVVKSTFPSPKQLLQYTYLAGLVISVMLLIYSFLSVVFLFRRAQVKRMNGFRLVIIDKEIPAFSFSHFVFMSPQDYEDHRQALLAHEQAHIRLKHFFDLILLETVKIFHWFNPVMYWLIRDLKEIHEFQADDYVLSNGIDSTQYQLLIIKKCVGNQRFALANSFNYCQIKKRITMINKQKTGTSGRWKVAAFLPLMALLPMAFGRTAVNAPPVTNLSSEMAEVLPQDSLKKWTEADFVKVIFNREHRVSYKYLDIRINSKSELIIGNKVHPWEDLIPEVQRYLDYSQASDELKPGFGNVIINGQERMVQRSNYLLIYKDESNSEAEYQNLLNKIGEAVMQTRQKFAGEIFGTDYQKLTARQKDDIDILVPALALFQRIPIRLSETATAKSDEKEKAGAVPVTTNQSKTEDKAGKGVPGSAQNRDEVFVMVEQMPQFPGGEQAMRKFIATNVRYPAEAQKNGISGKVYVSFVINPNGKVDRAKIVRGVDPALDAEALRVVNLFPDWTPGKQRGKAVDVTYTVPIIFTLLSNDINQVPANTSAYLVVDEMPSFPGGEKELHKYISGQIKYPAEALKEKIQGEVLVSFIVKSDGKVENAKVVRGVHPLLDAEAVRVVNLLPDWKPGIQDRKTVDVACTAPVKFILP